MPQRLDPLTQSLSRSPPRLQVPPLVAVDVVYQADVQEAHRWKQSSSSKASSRLFHKLCAASLLPVSRDYQSRSAACCLVRRAPLLDGCACRASERREEHATRHWDARERVRAATRLCTLHAAPHCAYCPSCAATTTRAITTVSAAFLEVTPISLHRNRSRSPCMSLQVSCRRLSN